MFVFEKPILHCLISKECNLKGQSTPKTSAAYVKVLHEYTLEWACIRSPQVSFVTEKFDFVLLIFAHIIAAMFVELGGGKIACIFERFDVIV